MSGIKINSQDVRLRDLVESIIWECDDAIPDTSIDAVASDRTFMQSVKRRCLLIAAEEGAE